MVELLTDLRVIYLSGVQLVLFLFNTHEINATSFEIKKNIKKLKAMCLALVEIILTCENQNVLIIS